MNDVNYVSFFTPAGPAAFTGRFKHVSSVCEDSDM